MPLNSIAIPQNTTPPGEGQGQSLILSVLTAGLRSASLAATRANAIAENDQIIRLGTNFLSFLIAGLGLIVMSGCLYHDESSSSSERKKINVRSASFITGATLIGIALLLKFFQMAGGMHRFIRPSEPLSEQPSPQLLTQLPAQHTNPVHIHANPPTEATPLLLV